MQKYKLINTKTKEEHLCDKVTIDWFDYYIDDKIPEDNDFFIVTLGDNVTKKLYQRNGILCKNSGIRFESSNPWATDSKKVIATNNSNIDIPQVVDEVEELAYKIYPKDEFWIGDLATGKMYDQNAKERIHFIKGYNKSQEIHPNSDKDMIDFYEWCDTSEQASIFWRRNKVDPDMSGNYWKKIRENREKLLQLWKEQQSKIVYYG